MPHFNQSIWCEFHLNWLVGGEEPVRVDSRKRERGKMEVEPTKVKVMKQEEEKKLVLKVKEKKKVSRE